MSLDLNIEGHGEVLGWSPPVGEVLTPGFIATMKTLEDVCGVANVGFTRLFIEYLEQKGYCIAKYDEIDYEKLGVEQK